METTLKIEGMTCNNCVKHVEHALRSVEKVENVQVSLEAGEAKVQHNGADIQKMIDAVDEEGYVASNSQTS